MKRVWTLMLAAAVVALPAATMFAQEPAPTAPAPEKRPARIQKRKANQQKRIGEGVESGELNAREAARLERKEDRLNREIRKDRVDGGGMTARERAKIKAKQDKLSRDIAKEKHDAQKRK